MRLLRPLVVVSIVAALAATAPQALVAQSSGVYTQAQAAQGATLYAAQCSSCHGVKLQGDSGPQLAGSDFMGKWTGQTAADVHDIVAGQMPLTAPGSLKPAESLALVAYVLQQNGYAPGDTALDAAHLKGVKIGKQQ